MASTRFVRSLASVMVGSVLLVSSASVLGCGGKKDADTAAEQKTLDVDGDPLALLSGSGAVAVANADAKAVFASPSLGEPVGKFVNGAIPVGEEAGFVASRDLDRLTFAAYAVTGADAVAVLRGRFDVAKFTDAAEKRVLAGGLVKSSYSEKALYTSRNVGVTLLTPKTALVGTEGAIRRTLDRIKGGQAKRDFAPWMLTTLDTEGAEIAMAADFSMHPLPDVAIGPFKIGWLKKLKAIRAVGDVKAPGLNVAGTITFEDAEGAHNGKDGIAQLIALASIPAALAHVPIPRDVSLDVKDADLQIKVAVEEATIKALLGVLHVAPVR